MASAHPLPTRPTARWAGPLSRDSWVRGSRFVHSSASGLQLLLSALSALQKWCKQPPMLHPICGQNFLDIPFSPKHDGHHLLSFPPSLHLPPSGIKLPKAGAMSVFCLFTVLWLPWGRLPGYRSHLSPGFLQIHSHSHGQHGIRIIKSFFSPVKDKQTERWEWG